jgi:hypothetical protein
MSGRRTRKATRIVVSTLGAVVGMAGIEHGIGEILQGNVAPEGVAFLSWPDTEIFRIVGGEPAMSIVPNLLITGILAVVLSLTFILWSTMFVERRHGGLVLILLSAGMLLFGGGFGPPLLGVILGIAATRIDAPLAWWRAHLSAGIRHGLGMLWPWSLSAAVVAWLALVPGSVILAAIVGPDIPEPVAPGLVYAVILAAFGFLLLAIVAGQAHDSLERAATGGDARA